MLPHLHMTCCTSVMEQLTTFYLSLNSNHWRLDVITFQDPFSRYLQTNFLSHYLIPPTRDTSVTTRLRLTTSVPRPNLRTKKYCSPNKLWPTPLPTNTVIPSPLYTSLPAPMYICAHCLFCLLFLSIINDKNLSV